MISFVLFVFTKRCTVWKHLPCRARAPGGARGGRGGGRESGGAPRPRLRRSRSRAGSRSRRRAAVARARAWRPGASAARRGTRPGPAGGGVGERRGARGRGATRGRGAVAAERDRGHHEVRHHVDVVLDLRSRVDGRTGRREPRRGRAPCATSSTAAGARRRTPRASASPAAGRPRRRRRPSSPSSPRAATWLRRRCRVGRGVDGARRVRLDDRPALSRPSSVFEMGPARRFWRAMMAARRAS